MKCIHISSVFNDDKLTQHKGVILEYDLFPTMDLILIRCGTR